MLVRVVVEWVVLTSLTLIGSADRTEKPNLKPTMILAGTHSAIRVETFDLVSTEEGWKELWKRHRGEERNPLFTESYQEFAVDFETHYVVAVFTGHCDWCDITPRQRKDRVLIGYKACFHQTEGRPPAIRPLPCAPDQQTSHQAAKEEALAPYAFVVLPKPVKNVVIEKDIQGRLGDPPVWKEMFHFPAPRDSK